MKAKIIASTPFGPITVVWRKFDKGPRVLRVFLSSSGPPPIERAAVLYPGLRPGSCREIDDLASSIRAFLEGRAIVFPLGVTALAACPPFQESVLRAEHAIPRGSVSTYGLIAGRIGDRNAARAVGNALAANPFPILVPCHRAVRADGGLGGFQGGPAMKRALLALEGVPFDASGRVAVPRFHYS
jgi:methylated-DNA-[protein]-cysteine S-methyltransferase